MSTSTRRSGLTAAILALLALVGLAGRSLVPDGLMVGTAPDGRVTLVLCTAQGSVPVTLDLATGEVVEDGKSGSHAPDGDGPDEAAPSPDCVAAAGVHLALGGPLSPVVTPVVFSAEPVPTAVASVSIGRGLAAPPPFPTGPPSDL